MSGSRYRCEGCSGADGEGRKLPWLINKELKTGSVAHDFKFQEVLKMSSTSGLIVWAYENLTGREKFSYPNK